jgi:hypothetical protein
MSLKIAESESARVGQISNNNKVFTEKIAGIKQNLANKGWTYPYSSKACSYASNIKETWKEIEVVINTIRSETSKKLA